MGTNEACHNEAAACPAGTKKNLRKECFLKTLKCCITGKLLVMRPLQLVSHQGRSQDFSKGGVTEATHPLLSLVYQRAQSYYRGMKAHIN